MTDSIGAGSSVSSLINNAVSSGISGSTTATTSTTSTTSSTLSTQIQQELSNLGIDSTDITSNSQAEKAIAKAEAKKAALEINDTVDISNSAQNALKTEEYQ